MDAHNIHSSHISGIYEKLPYLKSLGIGCLWLSPILKSPMVDFGYDVSNFREIDPLFGDMDDFEALVKRSKQLGRLILNQIRTLMCLILWTSILI